MHKDPSRSYRFFHCYDFFIGLAACNITTDLPFIFSVVFLEPVKILF